MICKFCGNVIDDNSDFCFICGQKNPAEEKEEQPEKVENNDVFSQAIEEDSVAVAVETTAPASPEAPVYDDESDVAPIYAQSAPIYAQSAPVYAQQVIIQQVAPAQIVKTRGPKDSSAASKALKFFAALLSVTFILQFIPWLWYKDAQKGGYDQKANSILNSIMIGLCIFMVLVCFYFIKSFMM